MKKINVLQYVPYFPPHMWWLETHAAQRGKHRVAQGYGECTVATYSIGQDPSMPIYRQDGYEVVSIPAIEIISWFPFPQFWNSQYWKQHRYLKSKKTDIVTTRTRFFVSSILWGIYAMIRGVYWVHIEHGVEYVKMNTRRKEYIAWIYAQIFWRLVFFLSDKVIWISQWCRRFAKRFTSKDIPVMYRWVEFEPAPKKSANTEHIKFWFVGRLTSLKWVDLILKAYAIILKETNTAMHFTIVGDWEERATLEALTAILWLEEYVTFLGYKNKDYLEEDFYPSMDVCLNASWQEWLPTSVIEPMLAWCTVVATRIGWTPEISDLADLILVEAWDIDWLAAWIQQALSTYTTVSWLSKEGVRKKFTWKTNIALYHDYFTTQIWLWK
jgi:glycosyltransferase involved in cell wall biosynthesis